ncbi:MAG: ribosome biogenesis GTPase Der [Gammaproteobacteria bacterium]|nr:MAG: ribosome biogenesis GTPase Der [Gammaproteobacteria bacterium]PIE36323.1 MAG: ribosome biogenesis GTPase Der [Gammaproteobacteria bacterium]
MKPVIALVGRPNVGKSTLFNKLTRSQDALVADQPGLTRDRQYGDGKVGNWPYLLVDTGGLSGAPESLDAAMADQTLQAVREADAVVFVVDGRNGLTPVDEDIAGILRRQAKQVLLCVNKIDGIGEDRAQLEFHQLGFEHLVPTAAAHNRGVTALVDELAELLGIEVETPDEGKKNRGSRKRRRAEALRELEERQAEQAAIGDGEAASTGSDVSASDAVPADGDADELRIAFIGRPNVGKSTLINRLLGEDRMIAYDMPGTTRDAVTIPFERAGREYLLVDTAGVRKRGKVKEKVEIFSAIKTMQTIDRSNVCVMLLDAVDGVTEQDISLLGYVVEKGRALVVAINKWDAISSEAREAMREELERRVAFLHFTRIHYISALHGSGVGDLFKSINRAWKSAFTDLSTPQLTRHLELATSQHQPPMVNGRRIRLRYAHQGGQNPPVIVIHGKQASKVPQSYRRYLANHFQKALRLFGTPLRIELRQDDNPFDDRPGDTRRKRRSNRSAADRREDRSERVERRRRRSGKAGESASGGKKRVPGRQRRD